MRGDVATVCRHVLDGAPILFAARDDPETSGSEWQFRCGAGGHGEDDDARALALEEVVRRDPSAVEIVLHPRGTALERRAAAARWLTEAGPVLFPHRPSRRYPRFEPRYPPRPGESLDAGDLRLMADVAQVGFHTAVVAGEGEPMPRAFSVGFFRSWDHPEVALFGLAHDDLQFALDRIGARIRAGDRFDHGDFAEGIVRGRTIAFRRIVPRHYPAHLGQAVWYHSGARFPALQAVWADGEGHFPWDRWFPRELRDVQPILFEPEPA
ncbi:MAG TPA: DUF4262 domain-containing protein [Anaeromyxobacter sp.]